MEYSEMKFIPSAMNFIPVGRVRFHNDTTTIVTKPRIHKASSIPVKYISRCKIDTNILKNCKKNQWQISYIRYLKSDIFSCFFYSCCSIIFFCSLQTSPTRRPSYGNGMPRTRSQAQILGHSSGEDSYASSSRPPSTYDTYR